MTPVTSWHDFICALASLPLLLLVGLAIAWLTGVIWGKNWRG